MMRNWSFLWLVVASFVFVNVAMAQNDRQYVRKGNRLFKKGDYSNALLEYQKALSVNENNTQAIYNMGCAALQMGNDSLAVKQFETAGRAETNKIRKAQAFHNIGVVMQAHQQYDQAIEAYKEALRNNPTDNETRYNLVLCKRQQKQNQQDQQNQQNQQNQDKNDKNKDQNQNKNQDKKQDKDQDKNQDQDKQDKNQYKQEQQQMSPENAQRLLDAAVQEEKRTQERLQKAMQQPRRKMLQKNW